VPPLTDDSWLLRGIDQTHHVSDDGRIKSSAFLTLDLSVHILSLDSVKFLVGRDPPFRYIAAVSVRDCREIGDLEIKVTPKEGEPGHVSICGTNKGRARKLRDRARRVEASGTPAEVYGRLCSECGVTL
jgi:hypothetical protein